jgi:hypothetical protein
MIRTVLNGDNIDFSWYVYVTMTVNGVIIAQIDSTGDKKKDIGLLMQRYED